MTEDEYIQSVKKQVAILSQKIINGEVSAGEGALAIYDLDIQKLNEEDFNIFTVFESETDHLPRIELQGIWDEKALKQKRAEFSEIENFYREDILKACNAILAKYS